MVQIVREITNEFLNIFQNMQNINLALFHSLTWNMGFLNSESELILSQRSDYFINLVIMHVQGIQVIESFVKLFTNFIFYVEYLTKKE